MDLILIDAVWRRCKPVGSDGVSEVFAAVRLLIVCVAEPITVELSR